jgi:hypothetical protein
MFKEIIIPESIVNSHKKFFVIGKNMHERINGLREIVKYKYNVGPTFSIYKFLHKKDLKFWLDEETVRINTLYNYAAQDSNGGLFDPNEIKVEGIETKIPNSMDKKYQLAIKNLEALGIASIGGGNINLSIKGTCIRKNRYVNCYSYEYNSQIMEKWNKLEGYDCCIEITQPLKFIKLINLSDFHHYKKLQFLACKYIGTSSIDDVVYENFPYDLNRCDFTYFSFHKDRPSFEWQKEVRICWPVAIDENAPPLTYRVPGIAKLIKRIV